jgi:nucleoside diphosphate kinase
MAIYDYSFFMTKPFSPIDDEEIEKRMILTLEDYLSKTNGFERVRNPFRIVTPKREFWEEFYAHTKEKIGVFEPMIKDLMKLPKNPFILFYSGKNITQRIIDKLGPATHAENKGLDTIREIYGIPSSPNWQNVAHAPKPDEVEKHLAVLRRHRLV